MPRECGVSHLTSGSLPRGGARNKRKQAHLNKMKTTTEAKLDRGSGDSVLQPSSIRHYRFPDRDPLAGAQPTRSATRYDRHAVEAAARSEAPDMDAFRRNTHGFPLPDKILYLLAHQVFNFNNKTDVRKDATLKAKIAAAVASERPVVIAYPLMCKIALPAKQFFNQGPTAGEEATLIFFRHLNTLVKMIYPPGIKFRVASDATLYDAAFRNDPGTVTTYVREISELITRGEMPGVIEFHDYAEMLKHTNYPESLARFRTRLEDGDVSIFDGVDVATLRESVRASINTRHLDLTYRDYADLYGPDRNEQNPHWEAVNQMAHQAFNTILPIRLACAEANAIGSFWPEALRASCHKGMKNGSWPLGLRVFPEYFHSCKLLPYHGVPLIKIKSRDANGSTRIRMEIHPEIVLLGRPEISRVTWGPRGETYFYDGREFDGDLELYAKK